MELTMLLSVALPGVLAGVLTLAAVLLPRTFNTCGKRDWAEQLMRCSLGALAIGGGFLVSFHIQEGLPDVPPTQRWHWLALMAAAAAVIGCIHGLWARSVIGSVLTGLLLAISAMLMLQPLPAFEQPWLWKVALGVSVLVLWLSTDALAVRRPGPYMPLVMMLTFCVASVAVVLAASSAKFAMMVASLACMSGVMMFISLFARKFSIAGGAAAVMSTLLPAWMLMAHFYDYEQQYPLVALLLIAAAPLFAWTGELPLIKRRGGWKAWLLSMTVLVVVLGAAATMVITSGDEQLEEAESYDSDFDYY